MPRPRRSDETRKRLLEAGARRLLTDGFHGTGLKSLLDEVGVPKGSFYNYFESKEQFGAEVIQHFAADFAARMEDGLQGAESDAMGALRRLLTTLITCYVEGDCGGGCLIGNLGGELEESDLCREALRAALEDWQERYARVIALAQEQGTVRRDLSAADLAALLVNAWEGALLRMKLERSPAPLRDCIEHLLDGYFKPQSVT